MSLKPEKKKKVRSQISALRKLQGSPPLPEKTEPITRPEKKQSSVDLVYAGDNRRWAERQAWLSGFEKNERDRVNAQIGQIKIRASENSSNPLHRGQFYSVDMSLASEMESPMRVDWNRVLHIRSFGYKYGKPILVEMSPDDFLSFAFPLREGLVAKSSLKSIKKGLKDNNTFSTPFLDVDENGIALGKHEGRHRALVLKEMGIKKMPVLIYDQKYKYQEHRDEEPKFVMDRIKELREMDRR